MISRPHDDHMFTLFDTVRVCIPFDALCIVHIIANESLEAKGILRDNKHFILNARSQCHSGAALHTVNSQLLSL